MGEQLIIELAKNEMRNKPDNFMKTFAFVLRQIHAHASAFFKFKQNTYF